MEIAGDPPPDTRRRRRNLTVLAAIVAAAVGIPLAVHTAGRDQPAAPRPQAAPKGPLTEEQAVRLARARGVDVEVTADRTARSTTWARPDGLLRVRTHTAAVRAKVGGEWKPIDTRLARVKGGYAPKAANDPAVFSGGAKAPQGTAAGGRGWNELVRLHAGGHEMVLSWPGAVPAPVVDGSRALYREILPGIDLVLGARDSGFSHALVVKDRRAAANPVLDEVRYHLSSPDLRFTLNKETSGVDAVDRNGKSFAASPTPYAWDSAGKPRTTIGQAPARSSAPATGPLALAGLAGPQPGTHEGPLKAGLTEEAGGHTLSLTGARALLDAPDTVYPVFLDPSFIGPTLDWTVLYKASGTTTSSFFNGQNWFDGTNEARVGYEQDSQGLSRSVFNIEVPAKVRGAYVKQAWLRVLQTYSWSCTPRRYDVWFTSGITSANTWAKQPSWVRIINSQTNAHGWKASVCPDKMVSTDITSAAREAATKWTLLGIGLRVPDSDEVATSASSYSWKKFSTNGDYAPSIEYIVNRTPDEPYNLVSEPGGPCDSSSPYPTVGLKDISFTATSRDDDDNLKYLGFKIWNNATPNDPIIDANYPATADTPRTVTLSKDNFDDKATYSWGFRAIDAEGAASTYAPPGAAMCQFTVDTSAPATPVVSSTVFPAPGPLADQWSTVELGGDGAFTFDAQTDTSVARIEYRFNTTATPYSTATPTTAGGTVSKTLKPPLAGPNILYARAVDAAGNVSAWRKYLFYVKPRAGVDKSGDLTGDNYPDFVAVTSSGDLRTYSVGPDGDPATSLPAAHSGGQPVSSGYWWNSTTKEPALVSHAGDWFPADGVNDLIARMPNGKLYIYPGDGFGSFDIQEHFEVLLPAGAPEASTLTQIVATDDITGDGRPDMLAIAGTKLWAFVGYTGGSFSEVRLLADNSWWPERDIVNVRDISGDGVPDLLFRGEETGRGLLLRHGKPAAGGGVDLASFGTAAASGTGVDEVYGTGGWERVNMPIVLGAPNISGTSTPDFWAIRSNGELRYYPGGTTAHGSPAVVGSGWTAKALG